jgi:hypothetical protein
MLGDFNVNRGPLYDALSATGLTTPEELNEVPRTIFDQPGKQHSYDQIAWFDENGGRSILSLFVPLLQEALRGRSCPGRSQTKVPRRALLGST